MAVLYLILYTGLRTEDVSRLHEIHWGEIREAGESRRLGWGGEGTSGIGQKVK